MRREIQIVSQAQSARVFGHCGIGTFGRLQEIEERVHVLVTDRAGPARLYTSWVLLCDRTGNCRSRTRSLPRAVTNRLPVLSRWGHEHFTKCP